MKLTRVFQYSDQQKEIIDRARKLEWWTLLYTAIITSLIYAIMGDSPAMRSAWIEDLLGAIPPVTFLITTKVRQWRPNEHFPYGYERVTSFGFLVSALTFLFMGLYLFVDNFQKLVALKHTTIGMKEFFGIDVWLGWWALPVLFISAVIPVILGRMKYKLADPIHSKILFTDAKMNVSDWSTAAATMVGIAGVGIGLWWSDIVAALLVSVSVTRDGWSQTKDAFAELMDSAPKNLKGDYIDLPDKLRTLLLSKKEIVQAKVRMREHGNLILSHAFIKLEDGRTVDENYMKDLAEEARGMNWRMQEVSIVFDKD